MYTSKNESHLVNAAISLSIPREYIPLIFLSKKVLDPIYISEESLTFLGAVDSIKLRKPDMNDKDFSNFTDSLMKEILLNEEDLIKGGNTANLKTYLV